MHEIHRNLMYQVKKQSATRSDPFFAPNSEQDDIRTQNNRLRTKNRHLETQIIRLNSKIAQLSQKLALTTTKFNSISHNKQQTTKQMVQQMSRVPMIMQNKQLKDQNQVLNRELLVINGKNNQMDRLIRELKSQKYGLEMRVKEFNILEKMREERFKDQVDRLTPIIIQQPAQFTTLKQSVTHFTKYLRNNAVNVAQNIFILASKQCEGNKKLNSFTVFNNYWRQLQQRKSYGYLALMSTYSSIRKVMKIIDQKYAQIDLQDGQLSGTIDEWVVNSVIQILNVGQKQKDRKLFRLLALKYRCLFPIQGVKREISEKVGVFIDDVLCREIVKVIVTGEKGKKGKNSDDSHQIEDN